MRVPYLARAARFGWLSTSAELRSRRMDLTGAAAASVRGLQVLIV
jgi:hypothetical protein